MINYIILSISIIVIIIIIIIMVCNIIYINDINNHQRLKNSEQLYGIYDDSSNDNDNVNDNDNDNVNDIKIDL
jgi:cellulose synthase/poly-beta-1,6-N-acetylglucosamine synthase-like glycosyltransferase